MKYGPLVWARLRRKPFRTLLTFLSIATAFLSYGGLSGTMVSFDRLLNQFSTSQLFLLSCSAACFPQSARRECPSLPR